MEDSFDFDGLGQLFLQQTFLSTENLALGLEAAKVASNIPEKLKNMCREAIGEELKTLSWTTGTVWGAEDDYWWADEYVRPASDFPGVPDVREFSVSLTQGRFAGHKHCSYLWFGWLSEGKDDQERINHSEHSEASQRLRAFLTTRGFVEKLYGTGQVGWLLQGVNLEGSTEERVALAEGLGLVTPSGLVPDTKVKDQIRTAVRAFEAALREYRAS